MNSRDEDFKQFFGNPLYANTDLVALGGDLSVDRLFYAYSHGIFPWTNNPIGWFCLDPRAIFDIDNFHISRTIQKKIKKNIYKITFNQSFTQVMEKCSKRKYDKTWITKSFIKGYTEFHKHGWAHSVEAWDAGGNLVGGVYGVAIGKFFAGESMFAIEPDAGKVALAHLFTKLKNDGFKLFDTQALNEVTYNLGAFEIPKIIYLMKLEEAVNEPVKWNV